MANQVVFDYIKNNRANFSLDELKEQIVSKGYSVEDFNEAVARADKTAETSGVIISGVNHSETKSFKWIMTASIIGFVYFSFGVLSIVLGFLDIKIGITSNPTVLFGIVAFVLLLSMVYFVGFFKVGQKAESKFLKIASILNIVGMLLLSIGLILIYSQFMVQTNTLTGFAVSGGEPMEIVEGDFDFSSLMGDQIMPSLIDWKVGLFLVFAGMLILFRYLFLASLIIVRKSAKFFMTSGIIGFVVMLLLTGLFGYLIYFLANPIELFSLMIDATKSNILVWGANGVNGLSLVGLLFESLALWNASKKFE